MSKNPEIEKLKTHPAVLRLYAMKLKGELHKEGWNYVTLCPFHNDRDTKSFKIDTRPNAKFLWRCFGGCNEGGDIIRFVEKIDRVDSKTAIETVKKFIGGNASDWDRQRDQVDEVFQPAAEEEPKEYKTISLEVYSNRFEHPANTMPAPAWLLKERGIQPATVAKLHFGYVQSVGKMGGDVADQGWISIPYIEGETVVYIKYRSIVKKQFCAQPGMRVTCFNLDTISTFDPVYVTEGEFDAAILEQAGFNAVSLPSSSHAKDRPVVSPAIKDQLMLASKVILAGDNDQAGNAVMDRLWKDLRSARLTWPVEMKDANQTFLEHCHGDVSGFRKLVEELTATAPIDPHVYSAAETMRATTRTNLMDSPKRLRFPWKGVDEMAIITPGQVMSIFATNTKQGKTTWIMNVTTHCARFHGEVVLNYQVELSPDEYVGVMAAHLLQKNRNKLTHDDMMEAAAILTRENVQYYIGRNQTLNTVTPVLDLIEAAIQRYGATIIVFDHIHFICRNEKDEVQAQANAMQRIKNMAGRYGVKFIVVGQPRKATQANRGKMVHITDAKGSESFASDADAVFAIHRDWIREKDPANPPMDDYNPETEVHMLGARFKGNGSTMQTLFFNGSTATFRELSMAQEPKIDGGQTGQLCYNSSGVE